MKTHLDKATKNKSQSVANAVMQKESNLTGTLQLVDNRTEANTQRRLLKMTDNSPRIKQLKTTSNITDNTSNSLGTEVIQRQDDYDTMLDQPNIMDNIMKHLSAKDLANFSGASRKTNAKVKPVVPQVLAQEMFQPPSAPDDGTLATSGNVEHIHQVGNPLTTRKKIDYLTSKKQIATRALNNGDSDAILGNQPMTGSGSGTDIAHQVETGHSALLSASKKPTNKFSVGSSGHAAIKRPEHYVDKARMHSIYPQTVKRPTLSAPEYDQHNKNFTDHDGVMRAVASSSDTDQRNAREAHEVMFQGPLPLKHVVNIDGGLPQTEHALSKAAIARREEKSAATASASAPGASYRSYKTHAAARAKLGKNSSLGTKYKLKSSGGNTVYDITDNVQDSTGKGKKKKRKG